MYFDKHQVLPEKKYFLNKKITKVINTHTISSPGRHVSQRSPSKRISFERGIRPGGTVPGLS